MPLLPTKAFMHDGIDEHKIGIVRETHFRSAYTQARFAEPLILIKEAATLPICYWNKGPLAYRDKIIGIHAPHSEDTELRRLYDFLTMNHRFCQFSCTLNGSQSLVGKATAILKQDIDALPYPESSKDISLAFWEESMSDDVLRYMTDYVRLGQNSQLLKRAANRDDLNAYSQLFVRMLGTIYENLRASDPVLLDGLTCQPFYFGKRPSLSWLSKGAEDELRRLVYDEARFAPLRTVRVLRFYLENVLLIVKPDRLRYWIRSTAVRDADETLVDLRQQGY
jgi:hypothetical protein